MSILNLTRKFRINKFEEVVGQQLVVRMLKNSLYTNRLFPVYLFFGQHGCGKTSIARIFAMSVNCHSLSLFRTTPKTQTLPCLTCDSCDAMLKNNHPDFIEIDAASYTGVDNIRTIIESASYLPVVGSKKIYLIDEAHMLSKAAFNALLKILEEPPLNALFMLATTDVEKIIDTVRSRCFLLALQPITADDIQKHLKGVMESENIPHEDEALWTIAEQANGSIRDALNLVERVRCAYPKITLTVVYHVLGKITDQLMADFFIALCKKNRIDVVALLSSEPFLNANPTMLWRQTFQFIRAVWYAKQGICIDKSIDHTIIEKLIPICSVDFLAATTGLLYKYEPLLLKTHTPRFFIEHIFTLIAIQTPDSNDNCSDGKNFFSEHKQQLVEQKQSPKQPASESVDTIIVSSDSSTLSTLSERFLKEVKMIVNPMIYSLFNEAHFIKKDDHIVICLPESVTMLHELLKNSEVQWLSLFKTIFGLDKKHMYTFTKNLPSLDIKKENSITQPQPSVRETNTLAYEKKTTLNNVAISSYQKKSRQIDLSDSTEWPHVNLILKYFPGTTTFIE